MHTIMLALTIVLATIAGRGYCQPTPPPNPQRNPDTVPIAGIEYLLAAGALYGAYRLQYGRKPAATKPDSPTAESP